jgi:hypothetical protein
MPGDNDFCFCRGGGSENLPAALRGGQQFYIHIGGAAFYGLHKQGNALLFRTVPVAPLPGGAVGEEERRLHTFHKGLHCGVIKKIETDFHKIRPPLAAARRCKGRGQTWLGNGETYFLGAGPGNIHYFFSCIPPRFGGMIV